MQHPGKVQGAGGEPPKGNRPSGRLVSAVLWMLFATGETFALQCSKLTGASLDFP